MVVHYYQVLSFFSFFCFFLSGLHSHWSIIFLLGTVRWWVRKQQEWGLTSVSHSHLYWFFPSLYKRKDFPAELRSKVVHLTGSWGSRRPSCLNTFKILQYDSLNLVSTRGQTVYPGRGAYKGRLLKSHMMAGDKKTEKEPDSVTQKSQQWGASLCLAKQIRVLQWSPFPWKSCFSLLL